MSRKSSEPSIAGIDGYPSFSASTPISLHVSSLKKYFRNHFKFNQKISEIGLDPDLEFSRIQSKNQGIFQYFINFF